MELFTVIVEKKIMECLFLLASDGLCALHTEAKNAHCGV